jgi:hypothetical protein
LDDDLEAIWRLATKLRGAIEASPTSSRPIRVREFPNGSCGEASYILGAFLADNGIRGFKYQSGKNFTVPNRFYYHAWLERNGLVVDITADQFEFDYPPVLISRSDRWYEEFELDEPGPSDFRELHDGFPEVARYYAVLSSSLT